MKMHLNIRDLKQLNARTNIIHENMTSKNIRGPRDSLS